MGVHPYSGYQEAGTKQDCGERSNDARVATGEPGCAQRSSYTEHDDRYAKY